MATRTDKGIRRFLMMNGADGTASNFTAAHLKNPADSGYIIVLKRILITNHGITASATAYAATFGRKDTDLADGSYAAQTVSATAAEDSTGDSAGVTATNSANSASTDAPTVTFGKVAMALKTSQEVRFDIEDDPDSGVVLTDGTGFVVKAQGAALNDMHVMFDWIEKKDLSV